ncbi:hypothetical protein Gohar_003441, partial [Gossypium harknessii]|nr:hypothetical protein [Gossypium harknessii]
VFRLWLPGNQLYPNEKNVLNRGNEKLIEELQEKLERLETLRFDFGGSMEEIKMEKLHTWVSSSIKHTSCIHTLSKVTIAGGNKLRDMTWLILAPNLGTLSIFECAKMEEILSEGKLGEVVVCLEFHTLNHF